MSERLTDVELDDLARWARWAKDLGKVGERVLRAVIELQERRTVDRGLVNSRQRNARWSGGRRRK